jgi:hypothetical protein
LTRNASTRADTTAVRNTAPKSCGSGNLSKRPAMRPPMKFPSEMARK